MMSDMHKAAARAFVLLLLLFAVCCASKTPYPIALPGCRDSCGNMSIPYPFGIGSKCSHNSWFNITCSDTQPTRTLITNLKWDYNDFGPVPVQLAVGIDSIDVGTSPPLHPSPSTGTLAVTGIDGGVASRETEDDFVRLVKLDMRGSPYALMGGMRNSLVASGCGGGVVVMNIHGDIVAGCSSVCKNNSISKQLSRNTRCYGIGCCQASIPTSLDYFQLGWLNNVLKGFDFSNMMEATLVSTSYIANNPFNATSLSERTYSSILQWRVPDLPIHSTNYTNSTCVWQHDNPRGYSCNCKPYYTGNPYLPYGCQVIKECEQCPHSCNAYRCPTKTKMSPMLLALGLGISLGTLLLTLILFGLYRLIKKRREMKQMESNFKKNGGLLLQQQMSATEGSIGRIKIFSRNELERATDNFSESRILGRGGQGTVHKGMLVDGSIVAVKRSMILDESQLGAFINEIVILSQVNHRNVVKLFGCCLETKVPLLVYEFIPNGTLFQHIHNPAEDFRITWKMRLQIATESAEALAYLHSSSNPPIYHRDIKTTNILLDDKYRAKIADFGTSKSILIDETHVTTRVQGTFGYIDPEYFQSQQLTDKSDVYSFGVVLVELLTSKRPVYVNLSQHSRSLASEFLCLMRSSRFYDIVDGEVLEEAPKEELDFVADLASQCLHLNGIQRPTMKEVATRLQNVFS